MEINKNTKITVFGDSITKGVVTSKGRRQVAECPAVSIIENALGVKITNHSTFGQTLSRLVSRGDIDKFIGDINPSDDNVVIISLGGNDSDYDWPTVAQNPEFDHQPKTPPKEFKRLMLDTIDRLQAAGVRVCLTSIAPMDSKRFFDEIISKQADPSRVLTFLHGDIENLYRHQEYFNSIVIKCAQTKKCYLIDIRSKLLYCRNYLDFYCDDGIHPNELGQRKIAEIILKQLKNN